ncbi:hypothetical protein F7Q99_36510 [Streptomyces kaniharaensis]|uniref:Uncharacterized protein n=1 Tax=Streptomyces kaniharaensis TaxID=212423 RepID=A0A6N7L0N6_9ACTN|nr:hypothetical protein [Streptomyces kaniharaensis]MQS17546.1 hypothetical protein [Streptomyces kaniharaensis]
MTTTGGVRVDHGSIERDLEERGYDGCHIEYVPEHQNAGGDARLLAAVQEAASAANSYGNGGTMRGQAPALTLAGVDVSLKDYWGPDSLTAWLGAFARTLEQQGFGGRVGATPAVMPPYWFRFGREPRAGAFIALEHPLTERPFAENWCREADAWAGRGGGEAHLAAGSVLQRDSSADVAQHLARSLANSRTATLAYLDPLEPRATRVWAQQDGLAVYQAHDPAARWEDLIDRARDAVLANAARARFAFADMTPKWAYGWADSARPLPAIPVHALYRNDPLWARRLPDVHALQLLTGAHLDRVRDLSAWTVTEVHPGRFLVQARDLAAWCAPGGPSDAVLARARSDFGPALAAPDDLT